MRRRHIAVIAILLVGLLVVGCGLTANPQEKAGGNGEPIGNEAPANNKDGNVDPDTPVSSESEVNFVVESPAENQFVESGKELTIKGKTKVQKFSILVEDGHDILGEAIVELEKAPESLEDFEVSLDIKEHTSPSGVIVLTTDGNAEPKLVWPIKFQ